MPVHIDPATGQAIQVPDDPMMGLVPSGPPPGPPPGAPPSELMAMLAGGMPPGGMPSDPEQQFKNPAEALKDLFGKVKSHPYLQMETDDADLAQIQKILSSMQDLLAKNQKQAEAALGVGPAQKYMMKQALPVG